MSPRLASLTARRPNRPARRFLKGPRERAFHFFKFCRRRVTSPLHSDPLLSLNLERDALTYTRLVCSKPLLERGRRRRRETRGGKKHVRSVRHSPPAVQSAAAA